MKRIQVAVGALCRPHPEIPTEVQVLIARRAADAHQGGLLEFPGGKMEAGEGVVEALAREFREEVGVTINPDGVEPLITIEHDYGDRAVRLEVCLIRGFNGEPRGLEGQPVAWHSLSSLRDQDFPDANRPIIRALKLPRTLLVTGETARLDERVLTERFRQWPGALCLLRAPELSADDYASLYERVRPAAEGAGIGLLLHGRADWLTRFPDASGVHLPWREAAGLDQRPVDASYWLGISCHNATELEQAERLSADYALLSPVQHTASHPEREPLGWARFRALTDRAALPVYAMGGVGPGNLQQALEAGAQGVAGIGFWWKQTESME